MQELNEDATPKGDPEPVTTGLGIWSVSFLADGTRTAYSKTDHFAKRLARSDFCRIVRRRHRTRSSLPSTRPTSSFWISRAMVGDSL